MKEGFSRISSLSITIQTALCGILPHTTGKESLPTSLQASLKCWREVSLSLFHPWLVLLGNREYCRIYPCWASLTSAPLTPFTFFPHPLGRKHPTGKLPHSQCLSSHSSLFSLLGVLLSFYKPGGDQNLLARQNFN